MKKFRKTIILGTLICTMLFVTTACGENKKNTEATSYVIYMVDTSAGNWMHWKVNGVTETNLPQGWSSDEEYIGPYPPGGKHNYEIYVFALKQPVEVARGPLNCRTNLFTKYAMELDAVEEGSSGNIISYGYLPGTYTREK